MCKDTVYVLKWRGYLHLLKCRNYLTVAMRRLVIATKEHVDSDRMIYLLEGRLSNNSSQMLDAALPGLMRAAWEVVCIKLPNVEQKKSWIMGPP